MILILTLGFKKLYIVWKFHMILKFDFDQYYYEYTLYVSINIINIEIMYDFNIHILIWKFYNAT